MNKLSIRSVRGFTLIELLVVITIIGILAALLVPAVNRAMDAAMTAKARNDVTQLVASVKNYQLEYGRLPTKVVSDDDGQEASQGWFQNNNDEIIRVLIGQDYDGLNGRLIAFLEPRQAKGGSGTFKDGMGTDFKFYDPWGTPYAIKLDTSYNNELEYYGKEYQNNVKTTVFAVSFGKNKKQQNPGKALDDEGVKVDDVVSFR